ncbi:hypothetical protein GYMLUDRAFT_773000 [Collybiopsis luxurians FD-317 M1]|uniref:Uncharacterized protein n=1 Tax=Collybiopsis luxurians FD-317 M1 TaxID=944289 RepID=A0A0D0C3V8_9AGAR|nr:hypothetical protein GYMLUDRAFT_773000 [Collybiopsis luxurians FD-317 M1]
MDTAARPPAAYGLPLLVNTVTMCTIQITCLTCSARNKVQCNIHVESISGSHQAIYPILLFCALSSALAQSASYCRSFGSHGPQPRNSPIGVIPI